MVFLGWLFRLIAGRRRNLYKLPSSGDQPYHQDIPARTVPNAFLPAAHPAESNTTDQNYDDTFYESIYLVYYVVIIAFKVIDVILRAFRGMKGGVLGIFRKSQGHVYYNEFCCASHAHLPVHFPKVISLHVSVGVMLWLKKQEKSQDRSVVDLYRKSGFLISG